MTANDTLTQWIDRTRRMAEYRDEAFDFLRRASAAGLTAAEDDVELVCRLWATADERDVLICEALTKFDEALFDTPGELEITRGAEPRPTLNNPNGDDRLLYVCAWTLSRQDGRAVSVALAADRLTGRLSFEVVDALGIAAPIPYPDDQDADGLLRSAFKRVLHDARTAPNLIQSAWTVPLRRTAQAAKGSKPRPALAPKPPIWRADVTIPNRVVVTGVGAISPVGLDADATWKSLLAGKSGVDEITSFDSGGYGTTIAAEVKGFDANGLLGRKEARRMDRFVQLGASAALDAVEDAGVSITDDNRTRVSVMMASGIGGIITLESQIGVLDRRGPPPRVAVPSADDAAGYGVRADLHAAGREGPELQHGLRLLQRG